MPRGQNTVQDMPRKEITKLSNGFLKAAFVAEKNIDSIKEAVHQNKVVPSY